LLRLARDERGVNGEISAIDRMYRVADPLPHVDEKVNLIDVTWVDAIHIC
jgi:hypothetical protein